MKKRKRLLDEAEALGFSREEIQALRVYVDNWNQDIVTKRKKMLTDYAKSLID